MQQAVTLPPAAIDPSVASARAVAPDAPADLAPGAYVLIEVSDSGNGIPPGVRDRVFDPFFTTKPIGQGTGLGLSQVRSLCQSAGGDARIESRQGEGTVVRMYLRRAEAGATAPAPADAQDFRDVACRILLVEDNPDVAHAMRSLLEDMGCNVTIVRSGEEARDRLAESPHAADVVLSDIEMPGAMDGIALAELLRSRYPHLPVILISGYAARLEQPVRRRYEVLPKPCSRDTLAEAIARALRSAEGEAAGQA